MEMKYLKNKPDDYYNNGIIEIARFGNHVVQRGIASPEDHKKLIDAIIDEQPKAKAEIDSLIRGIRKRVAMCDPLQLLSLSQGQFFINTIGTTSEFQKLGIENVAYTHTTEYIQSIYASTRRSQTDMAHDIMRLFTDICNDIVKLYALVHQYYFLLGAVYQRDEVIDDNLAKELLEAQAMYMVRGNTYQVIEKEYYSALLLPHDEIFKKLFGLKADEVISGITKLQYALSQERFDTSNRFFDMLDDIPETESFDSMSEDQVKTGQEFIEQFFGAKLNDVCKVTGWDASFVREFAYRIGEDTDFFSNADYPGWPIIHLPIQRKPFIKINECYYCFDYYSFIDNFYRVLQKAVSRLAPDYNWSNVQQNASEAMVANTMRRILPGCDVYTNNFYPKVKSLKQLCENDLLVIYYDVAIIIEIKAGSFVYTAPMFDYKNHIASYKKLIEEPSLQCKRTSDYINTNDIAILYNEDRTEKARIDMSAINDTYMMSVTIDNINTFAAKAEKLSFLNLNYAVLCIAVDDLMIYQRYFDSPLKFLHYLKHRRAATTIKQLLPSDELDHLGLYKKYNDYAMEFNSISTSSNILPVGFREELDGYFAKLSHPSLNPIKPQQQLPRLYEDLISFLDKSDVYNKVQITNYLLDFCTDARNYLFQQVESVLARQKQNKRRIAINVSGRNPTDLRYTCFVNQPEITCLSPNYQQEYVLSTVLWNGEKQRSLLVISFDSNASIVNVEYRVYSTDDVLEDKHEMLYNIGKERAEIRIKQYLSQHKGKIRPNVDCPCGSGKKYKKCCSKNLC